MRDTLAVPSKPLRLVRDVRAQAFAADIRAQSTILAATDLSVASKLSTITAGFTGYVVSGVAVPAGAAASADTFPTI